MDKPHILVVDDNHINRLFFESSIKKLGFAVSHVKDGFAAVAACETQQFDLILMDIRMDGMDGIQCAALIKQMKQHSKTPILAVSAEPFDHSNQDNFKGSLLKPVTQKQLQANLNQHLNNEQVFDHQQALKVSHFDEEIVQKLRTLLLDQLPQEQLKISTAYEQKDWQKMNQLLHQLLGSSKICGARMLSTKITELQVFLKKGKAVSSVMMSELDQVIDATIGFKS
ncbi:response regulator [Marinicella sp. S1101]|uniref:Hpt domain-containing response regulator n=1 Tax=Marinicella marina TaxID=2996016 RepID=UPI002260E377|nr:response regulator [Marinicella marina]MCX7554145.1 response regulator [Marinicella marina]MDJ1141162.1 response regulator [Marinicella marina]